MSNQIKKKITLVHLYPKEMNIYGDMGNVITLKNRAQWRDIGFEIINVNLDNMGGIPQGDIYFMGGGQDNDMYKVFEDLNRKKTEVKDLVDANKVFLLICGGFQLFGDYFLDSNLREIKGLGILPVATKAPGSELKQRCLGNLVGILTDELLHEINKYYSEKNSNYLVGFENHSGQTIFTDDHVNENATVIIGSGNNSTEKKEGAHYKNIFASYMHGSLLPKNPHFADMLIGKALENKFDEKIELSTLDDSIEWDAHNAILKKMAVI